MTIHHAQTDGTRRNDARRGGNSVATIMEEQMRRRRTGWLLERCFGACPIEEDPNREALLIVSLLAPPLASATATVLSSR